MAAAATNINTQHAQCLHCKSSTCKQDFVDVVRYVAGLMEVAAPPVATPEQLELIGRDLARSEAMASALTIEKSTATGEADGYKIYIERDVRESYTSALATVTLKSGKEYKLRYSLIGDRLPVVGKVGWKLQQRTPPQHLKTVLHSLRGGLDEFRHRLQDVLKEFVRVAFKITREVDAMMVICHYMRARIRRVPHYKTHFTAATLQAAVRRVIIPNELVARVFDKRCMMRERIFHRIEILAARRSHVKRQSRIWNVPN